MHSEYCLSLLGEFCGEDICNCIPGLEERLRNQEDLTGRAEQAIRDLTAEIAAIMKYLRSPECDARSEIAADEIERGDHLAAAKEGEGE